ncbi:hypothetical protein TanjilG_09574 [Lupinus angustifolius]|uniref:Uncharacterized protein n=1 Tax=Lupinus angustifolius TaxID=3871 RepID=A0A1J7GUX6_LUPAN|nr:PREDICTED: protein ENHANCED DISEASE RESISTANCE 4 [Lupinus angustifolius]OIV98081.1 hypothetical protein TanjilG_09574 [Lupinus angustifolius]
MSGELASELRLVKCPKCWLFLPENPKYNVYKCGGCGTFLQAKKKRSVAVNSESTAQETAAATRNTPVPLQENGLKAKANSSSSREFSLDGNVQRGQNRNGNCNGEIIGLGPFNLSDEELETELDIYKLSHRRRRFSNKGSSNKNNHCEIEEITSSSNGNDNNEKPTQVGVKSEMEIIGSALEGSEVLDNGNLSLERAQDALVSRSDDEDDSNGKSDLVDATPEVEMNGHDLEGLEELNDGNLLSKGAEKQLSVGSDGKDADTDKLALAGANPEVETSGSDSEGTEKFHNGSMSLKGEEEEIVSRLNNNKSSLVVEKLEVEISGRNIAGEVNGGKLLLERAEKELIKLALVGHDPNNEKSVLVGEKSEVDITVSTSAPKRSNTQNFVSEKRSILPVTPGQIEEGTSGNHVSSNKQQKESQKNIQKCFDRVRSMDTLDSPEPSGIPGGLYTSQATRRYYGYDDSVSSYDGKYERFPIQHLDSFENTYKVANSVSEGRSKKGKGHVNSMLYGDHGTRHQPYFPNEKHHVVKDSRRNQKKVQKSTTQHGHHHWMRAKREEFPPRIPFHQSGFQSRYESCSPSNQMHDETLSREDNDQEKMKLFRMIRRLQDQLNRTRSPSRETNGRLPTCVSYKGKHIPAYHSHDLHDGRFSQCMDHPIPTCNGRCNHGLNWHQRHKFSRIPYSYEETSSAHHADHSCFNCCPQHELYRSYPRHDCWSSNSTPHRFKTSQFPVFGRETKSGDQMYMFPEVKKYVRRKQNLGKRYYKPVAGGAPFVTCHKYLNLLHLPSDFLLFERACHQIKCGGCSEILKFALQNGNHIASYSPSAIGSPSGDFDDQKEVINNSSNLPSKSHANYYHYTPADPISISAEREKTASRHSSTSKAPVKADQSPELSSNMTVSWKLSSEKEAKQPRKSPPLHKLMGYTSPSQVIRGTTSLEAK